MKNPLIGTTRRLIRGPYKDDTFKVVNWKPKPPIGHYFLTLAGYYRIRFNGKLQWLEGQEMRQISEEI